MSAGGTLLLLLKPVVYTPRVENMRTLEHLDLHAALKLIQTYVAHLRVVFF